MGGTGLVGGGARVEEKSVTRQLLWEECVSQNDDAPTYCYSQFCARFQKWRRQHNLSMPQQHRPAEKCFIDYSGDTVPVFSGDVQPKAAQIFVATLGVSGYIYAEATWTQQSCDWLASNTRMLEFYGGVPKLTVPDNLKSGIKHPCRYDPGSPDSQCAPQ